MLTKTKHAVGKSGRFKEDGEILENLTAFVDDFEKFQSGKEAKKIQRQEMENNCAKRRLELLSSKEIKTMPKSELVKLIFRINCQFVDHFFRKEYFSKLIQLSKEQLEEMAGSLKEQSDYIFL